MNLPVYIDLLVSFTRATLLGFGGGPSIIPLYKIEVVDHRGWLTEEQFGQALALGNSLPGPIATKISAFIGYKVAGWLGVGAALIGVVLPTALLMVALVAVLNAFRDNPYIKGATSGVRPVVFVMLAMLAYDFAGYAFAPGPGGLRFLPLAIAGGYFVAVHYLSIHPFWGVLASLAVGAVLLR